MLRDAGKKNYKAKTKTLQKSIERQKPLSQAFTQGISTVRKVGSPSQREKCDQPQPLSTREALPCPSVLPAINIAIACHTSVPLTSTPPTRKHKTTGARSHAKLAANIDPTAHNPTLVICVQLYGRPHQLACCVWIITTEKIGHKRSEIIPQPIQISNFWAVNNITARRCSAPHSVPKQLSPRRKTSATCPTRDDILTLLGKRQANNQGCLEAEVTHRPTKSISIAVGVAVGSICPCSK